MKWHTDTNRKRANLEAESDMKMEILAVVVGWILGLLSTSLVAYLSGIVERRKFKDVLKEELRGVRFRHTLFTEIQSFKERNNKTCEP